MAAGTPHIALFDLYCGGHHGQHMRLLIEYWGEHEIPGRLDVVVPPRFVKAHSDVLPAVDRYADRGARLVHVDVPTGMDPGSTRGLIHADRIHGKLLGRYMRQSGADYTLCLFFDHTQISLALDLRFPGSGRIGGIYFRPSFHYPDLRPEARPDIRERITQARKRWLLRAALRNPHFAHLFCLDPFAVPYVDRIADPGKAIALPEPVLRVHSAESSKEVRERRGIESGRRLALFFGRIDSRKGIFETLDALALLAPASQRRLAVLICGSIREDERPRILDRIDALRRSTGLQVILDDRFVEEKEIAGLYRAADLSLVPYQKHIGSSGVLVHSADRGVPVIGSDYGLVGEYIRRYRLGLAVDTTDARTIAEGLELWLLTPDELPFDAARSREYAEMNSAEAFASTIFQHVAPTR